MSNETGQSRKNILIVGTGGIGQRHLRAALATGRLRVSIVEPDEARRREVAAQYPVESSHADLGEVRLSEFALAVICAPANWHMALGQTCAEAGLPFLLEKPLAVSMDGVDRLLATVRAKSLPVRVAYVTRATPEALRLREQVRAGRIGPVRMSYSNISQEFPKYRPDYQRTYYARESTGGGAILDGASHRFDLLTWLMGPVTEVAAMYDRLELQGVECEDSALISLRFRSGAMAQIAMNQFQKPNVNTLELIGPTGNLVMDLSAAEVRYCGDDSNQWQVERFRGEMSPRDFHERRFRRQLEFFLDAMEGKDCPLATLEEARHNLQIAIAAKQSYREKRIVTLAKEE